MRPPRFSKRKTSPKKLVLITIFTLIPAAIGITKHIYIVLPCMLVPLAVYILFPLWKKLYFKKKLEEEFSDFLALNLTMEANGLRLDNILDEALNKKLELPSSYMIVAKIYNIIKSLNPDPYTGLRYLAKLIPSERISRFLRGYTEILVTTNDTLTYVESKLDEELASLEQKISRSLSSLDTLYEGLLIVLMSIITFMLIPVAYVPKELIAFIVSIIGAAAYTISSSLTSCTYRYETPISQSLSLILLIITPFLIIGATIEFIALYTIFIAALVILLRKLENRFDKIENELVDLIEDLYSEAKQGIPIDHALMKKENLVHPIDKIRDFLRLGINIPHILQRIKLSPFSKKLLSLVFSPLEYSRYHEKHLGYTLKIMDSIVRLRRLLSERGRMYFFYALTLPVITIVMIKGMTTIQSNLTRVFDPELALSLTYSISLIAGVIASKISSGKSLYSFFIPILLSSTLVSFYIANTFIPTPQTPQYSIGYPFTTPIGLILTTSFAIPTR